MSEDESPVAREVPEPPDDLGAGGLRLWSVVVEKYDLRLDELDTLEDVCRIADMLAALTKTWVDAGSPYLTKGSMGQEVIHPLIGEIRTQRAAKNALWRQLKLPDDLGAVQPNQQRGAAAARWANRPRGA